MRTWCFPFVLLIPACLWNSNLLVLLKDEFTRIAVNKPFLDLVDNFRWSFSTIYLLLIAIKWQFIATWYSGMSNGARSFVFLKRSSRTQSTVLIPSPRTKPSSLIIVWLVCNRAIQPYRVRWIGRLPAFRVSRKAFKSFLKSILQLILGARDLTVDNVVFKHMGLLLECCLHLCVDRPWLQSVNHAFCLVEGRQSRWNLIVEVAASELFHVSKASSLHRFVLWDVVWWLRAEPFICEFFFIDRPFPQSSNWRYHTNLVS